MVHRPAPEPLSWIAPEVERVLAGARLAFERARAHYDPHYDPETLRQTASSLHETRGVLIVAGLEGFAQYLDMLGRAMEKVSTRPDPDPEAMDRLQRAAIAAENYFLELIHSGKDQPLRLGRYYLELAALAGEPSAAVSDLFQFEVSTQPRPQPVVSDEGRIRAALLRRFEKGLVGWFKPADEREAIAALTPIREALAGFLKLDAGRPLEPLWLAALAYADALREARLPRDEVSKRILHDLHRTMRHAGECPQPPRRLLQALTYPVARLEPRSRAQRLLHEHWRLAEALEDQDLPLAEIPFRAQLDTLAEGIDRLIEHWERLTQASSPPLGAFSQELDALRRLAQPLGRASIDRAIEALAALVQWMEEQPDESLAAQAQLELARTLLILSAYCRAAHWDERIERRLQTQIERLRAFVEGRPLPEFEAQATEADSRSIGKELSRLLAEAETLLDRYYRDPTELLDKAHVNRLLAEARATLLLIGADEEAKALAQLPPLVERLAEQGILEDSEQRQLVETLAYLHTRTEALARGESLEESAASVPQATAVPLQELFAEEGEALGTDLLLEEESSTEEASILAPELAPSPLPEQAIEPIPAPPSEEQKEAAAEDELLDIFLEEAREVLATLECRIPELRERPDDVDALTEVRRSIHTLKGSGRMVGLNELGECAWALEQTLNAWLQRQWPATPVLIQLLQQAHRLFADWVEAIAAGRIETPARAAALAAEAERLRSLESPETAPQAEPLPPPEPPKHVFGDRSVSRTVFDAFRQEARERLTALRSYLDEEASTPPDDTLVRHVHTLAGISATAKIFEMHDLARALELGLERLAKSHTPPDALERDLLCAAAEWLDTALEHVEAGRIPELSGELPSALEAVGTVTETAAATPSPPEAETTSPRPSPPEAAALPTRSAPEAPPESLEAAHPLPQEIDPQLLPVFLDEGEALFETLFERLDRWDETNEEKNREALARTLHTLKGSARMAGALELGERIHRLEQELKEAGPAARDLARNGIDAAYAMFRQLAMPVAATATATTIGAFPPEQTPGAASAAAMPETERAPTREPAESQIGLRVQAGTIDRLVNDAGEIGILRARAEQDLHALRAAVLELTDDVIRLRSHLRELEIQAETQMQTRILTADATHAEFDPLELDRYTRLQELTRLIAEGIADVATIQQSALSHLDNAESALNQQARLTREVQHELMQIRSAPVASVAARLHRVVRQTAKELGKRVNLDIEGGQITLDRALLERMVPLLEHLLRNAVAHGIELPQERQATGKAEFGQITLAVRNLGSEIEFLVQDDGRGLDYAAILERARSAGLLAPDARPDEAGLARLVFLPGFSTAGEVSQIAGRGVGLDVVHSEIQALGGRIDLVSTPAHGTTFRILLPATLAITQALLVRALERRWAIPANLIVQTARLPAEALRAAQQTGHVIWQEKAYPLRYLPHLLDRPNQVEPLERRNWVILLASGEERLALHVDELAGNQEVIAKPAGPHLKRIAGMLGATLLADGEITLILNPVALARTPAQATAAELPDRPSGVSQPKPLVLVVDDSLTVRRITGRLLERAGYEVVLAKDGMDALDKLASLEHLPVAILSDIEMPRMDGFELLRQIRADARTRDLPVVFITSRLAEKHQAHAMALGANAYLGKPYDEDELLRLLRRYREAAAQPA
ncbi:Hpt domain-containing protein [Tepidiphilus sp. J10]|uniref:Hpt domain-containing protein n=1 Tax=Tepidiphilus sp. J10 TaxID=2502185 RepID=UPI00115C9F16|nr:Hpt domain-containing protein [Tepidiphilus sp. J10]